MYQVIEHYHQNDYRYKSKAVKGKTLEETNQKIVCSFQHKSDVIDYLERSYGQDYKSEKNCFCQILDRENSKYVILGDCEQIDKKNKNRSILKQILDLFKDSDFVGTVEFQPEDCVRNPLIPKILDKLKGLE